MEGPVELAVSTRSGLRLAGRRWGRRGGFPLLALHGWLDNGATWDALLPHLAAAIREVSGTRGFDVVALDAAGHGRSGHRHAQAHYDRIADAHDAVAVADALGWDTFALLGHSMGGINAMLIAGLFPARIRHVIVIEAIAPLCRSEADAVARIVSSLRQHDKFLGTDGGDTSRSRKRIFASLDQAVDARAHGTHPLSIPASRLLTSRGVTTATILKDGVAHDGLVWSTDQRLLLATPFPMTRAILAEILHRIRCPILCIMADHDLPQSFEDEGIRRDINGPMQMRRMKGMPSHHLHLEQDTAPAVAKVIAEFWSGLAKRDPTMFALPLQPKL